MNKTKKKELTTEQEEEIEYKRMLVELSESKYWKYIMKQSRSQDKLCIDTLISIDMFKEPTTAARMQGMSTGLFSLESEVISIINSIKKSNSTDDEEENYIIP